MRDRPIKRSDIDPREVAKLYRAGKTTHDIARHFSCSTRTALKKLYKSGETVVPVGRTKRYPLKPPWRERNPERYDLIDKARRKVAYAIKTGKLVRPPVCENCTIPAKEPPQAAHEDYSRPLDVRWLCRACHSLWDHDHPKSKRVEQALKRR